MQSWFSREETEIVRLAEDGTGQPAIAADLKVGQKVQAFYSGPMLKSYPGQVGADKVIILAESPDR